MISESNLVEDVKRKDHAAFKKLVDQYQEMVLNTCYGFVHDIDDAKDLTQEVFIKIYDSIHKFRGDAKLSTWIYRISVNKSLNFIRAAKKVKITDLDALSNSRDLKLRVHHESELADIEMEREQRSRILFKAIDSLNENQRIAFSLNKLEDVSYNEIGEIMNISLPAVESLIHRAKLNLQKKLIKYYKKNLN
ncbi:MAG: RNA polymerase subunit sigma-70 [Bacteroidetes bacterium HGW-Bacteroidetes-17]|jgi:RNA polymerase sigma-70 factor (ECF subfamily)|nr:MAG: RNA polymerase subunit sigma-70 [Bacteroidetes bacterium HGW-Bacteroidetes-17]